MPKKRQGRIERSIENALRPGELIDYRDEWAFIAALDTVRTRIAASIETGEAARAALLLETFVAGCFEKSEEVDDSDGQFGTFVDDLFRDWVRARQTSGANPGQTVAMLMDWIAADGWGYTDGLELEAAEILDSAGLRALERSLIDGLAKQKNDSYGRQRAIRVLKAIYKKRRSIGRYRALCDSEGELTGADCEALARMFRSRGKLADALDWAERGLALDRAESWPHRPGYELPQMRREILKKLGRTSDALESAWKDYLAEPSVFSFEDLMKCAPSRERARWRGKALRALDGAGLEDSIPILVHAKEADRLAAVVERAGRDALMRLSHYVTEPAAELMARKHPDAAAELHTALALRILEGGKSRFYREALDHLKAVRKIRFADGQGEPWQQLATEIRTRHGRKFSFMPGFDRLDAAEPDGGTRFLERARKRWVQKRARRPDVPNRGRGSGRR